MLWVVRELVFVGFGPGRNKSRRLRRQDLTWRDVPTIPTVMTAMLDLLFHWWATFQFRVMSHAVGFILVWPNSSTDRCGVLVGICGCSCRTAIKESERRPIAKETQYENITGMPKRCRGMNSELSGNKRFSLDAWCRLEKPGGRAVRNFRRIAKSTIRKSTPHHSLLVWRLARPRGPYKSGIPC